MLGGCFILPHPVVYACGMVINTFCVLSISFKVFTAITGADNCKTPKYLASLKIQC